MEKEWVTKILVVLKLTVFISLLAVSFVMYKLGNRALAGGVLLIVVLYMILNRLDALERNQSRGI